MEEVLRAVRVQEEAVNLRGPNTRFKVRRYQQIMVEARARAGHELRHC